MRLPTVLTTVLVACVLDACAALAPPPQEATVTVKVAAIHFRPDLGPPESNIPRLEALVAKSMEAGAKLVVAPELATTGFNISRDQARGGWGVTDARTAFARIRRLAADHDAYVAFGFAESTIEGRPYNSAAVVAPDGSVSVHRKRANSESGMVWSFPGDTPIQVVPTPFGDLAVLICSETYLMDWVRIAALKGADIVALPANWWGEAHQMVTWGTRAKENGVWLVVANRWGRERSSYPPPTDNYMDDAPTAVFAPSGIAVAAHRAQDETAPADTIVFAEVRVPRANLGTANGTYTVSERRPEAYEGLASPHYNPTTGNSRPDLPPAGTIPVTALAYTPAAVAGANLYAIRSGLAGRNRQDGGLVLLPGLGLTVEPVGTLNAGWQGHSPWPELKDLLAGSGAEALIGSVLHAKPDGTQELAAVVVTADDVELLPQSHSLGKLQGTGKPVRLLRLRHGLVAVATGADSLFPEFIAAATRQGADLIAIPSELGGRGGTAHEAAGLTGEMPPGWAASDAMRAWQTLANGCVHIAAVDAGGFSFLVDGSYCMVNETRFAQWRTVYAEFTSGAVRDKILNVHQGTDLDILLRPQTK